jgi:hypothetical protein
LVKLTKKLCKFLKNKLKNAQIWHLVRYKDNTASFSDPK